MYYCILAGFLKPLFVNRKSTPSHDSATLPTVIKERDVEYQVMYVCYSDHYICHFFSVVSPTNFIQSTTTGMLCNKNIL